MSQKSISYTNTPTSQRKFFPYLKQKSKRLTLLLSDCDQFQGSLVDTMKGLYTASVRTKKMIKAINKAAVRERPNENFQKALQKYKLSKETEFKSKTTEMRKKIDSIIKSPILNEKFLLKRVECRDINEEDEKQFIGIEEINSTEGKDLLKYNKRSFGEHFKKDLVIPVNKDKKMVKKEEIKKQKRKEIFMKPKVLKSFNQERKCNGTVSQLVFKDYHKRSLKEEEKEMLGIIMNERKNATERMTVQKLIKQKSFR
jgi:hypothetical protein